MKQVTLSELKTMNFHMNGLEVFPASWKVQKEFSLYLHQPRESIAFFFVCADIQVTFYPIQGTPVIARQGDVIYIPEGSLYYAMAESDSSEITASYTVSFRLLDESGSLLLLSDRITLLASQTDSLLAAHFGRLSESVHQLQKNMLTVKAEFYALLDAVSSASGNHRDAYYPIRTGANALRSEWNRNKKIGEYAKLCGVSNTYFYQCFRRLTGKSPVEYRNSLRLSNAETMLRLTDLSIGEISETIGFPDSFYFCRLFSRQFGMSPQKYRQQWKTLPK